MIDIHFSVDEHDRDGDVTDEGIFLHFGETRIKVADNLTEASELPDRIQKIIDEIAENWRDL